MRLMSRGQLRSTIKDTLKKDNLCHPIPITKGNMPIPGLNYTIWSRECRPLLREKGVSAGLINSIFEGEHR